MSSSVWDLLRDATYRSDLAVSAVLTVACGEVPQTIRVMDWTDGALIDYNGVDIGTLHPAADVRMTELTLFGITLEDLRDASLTLNDRDWTVKSHLLMPAPTGQSAGEVRLWLEKA